MSLPKISIVTPSFNQGQFIEQTILSVISQNYPNLEYIIIDGGSTDNTVEIIKKYEKHISYWVSEKDFGQSDAINKGILKANGDIFNWLNSDDYYAPGALHSIAKSFTDTKSDVVCGQCLIFGKDYSYISEPSSWFNIEKGITINPRINQPATFFKMEIIKSLGSLNAQLHYCMDLEWWMKYLFTNSAQKITTIQEVLVHFREHENSKTISLSEKFIDDKCLLYGGILAKKNKSTNVIGNYSFDVSLEKVPENFILQLAAEIFFMGAVVFYGKRDMQKAKLYLSMIHSDYLNNHDRKLFDKMKIRLKYIPATLFNLSDKLRKS